MTDIEYQLLGICTYIIIKCSIWAFGVIAVCRLGIKVCEYLIQRNRIKLKELDEDVE